MNMHACEKVAVMALADVRSMDRHTISQPN